MGALWDVLMTIVQDEKKIQKEIKLLLLGAGASGKSTVLKVNELRWEKADMQQMRLIHNVAFTPSELECEYSRPQSLTEDYRQLVFVNIVNGMKLIIDAMDSLELAVAPENRQYIPLIDNAPDINSGQSFPLNYKEAISALWQDETVQLCWSRGNENALPENLT